MVLPTNPQEQHRSHRFFHQKMTNLQGFLTLKPNPFPPCWCRLCSPFLSNPTPHRLIVVKVHWNHISIAPFVIVVSFPDSRLLDPRVFGLNPHLIVPHYEPLFSWSNPGVSLLNPHNSMKFTMVDIHIPMFHHFFW